MLFAALPDPSTASSIGWLVLVVAALCAAVNQVHSLIDRWKAKPGQPPNEQLQQAHLHLRSEFDRHVEADSQEHKDIFRKLGGVERGVEERLTRRLEQMAQQDKESRRNMHEEIGQLQKDVSALKATSEITNQTLAILGTKFDRLLERLGSQHKN